MSGARPVHNRRSAVWRRRAQAGNQEERATRADHTRRCQARRAVMTDANDEPAATEPDKPNQTPPTPAGSPEDFSLRSEEHTSELQSLMSNSYAVFCLKQKKN